MASTAPVVPATNIGAMTRPNKAMATVTQTRVRLRPRSARMAESGIVSAKKTIANNCISRNWLRGYLSGPVPQARANTVIR
jgi:hypothetical protein